MEMNCHRRRSNAQRVTSSRPYPASRSFFSSNLTATTSFSNISNHILNFFSKPPYPHHYSNIPDAIPVGPNHTYPHISTNQTIPQRGIFQRQFSTHQNLRSPSSLLSSNSFYFVSNDRSIVSRSFVSNPSQSIACLIGRQVLSPLGYHPSDVGMEEEVVDYRGGGDGLHENGGRRRRSRRCGDSLGAWKVLAGLMVTAVAAKFTAEFLRG